MIDLKPEDVGRKVVYTDNRGEGVIASFNDHFVFVRYGADVGSKGTRRENLEWLTER